VAPAFRHDAVLAVGRLTIQGEGLVHRTVTAVWRTYFQPLDAVEAHETRSRRDAHAEDD
jgi:hypothetical protein